MANIKQSAKRARQGLTRRAHNMALRSRMRTHIKKVLKAIDDGDRDAATEAYRECVPMIDTMVTKGIVHRNKAARHKSRLNARIRTI